MKIIMNRYKYLISIFGVLIIGLILIFGNKEDINTNAKESLVENIEEKNIEEETVYVDLKGAVNNPGVYEIEKNSRVIDVVNLAGGFLDTADNSVINLSKKLEDEMTIIVYTKSQIDEIKKRLLKNSEPTIVEIIKEVQKECNCPDNINQACINEYSENSNKININTATKEQLMTLPSIGESKANDIIDYRVNNRFNSIDDIKNVSGIGDATFERFKDLITI